MTDPYSKLGVTPNASVAAIKKAYRVLAKSCHPDLRSDKEAAAIEFRELTRIYEIALSGASKPTKPTTQKPKPPPPPKPSGPIIHKVRVVAIDDFEFTMFGEATRFAAVPPEVFEYGGTVIVEMASLDGSGSSFGSFQFEVPPKTKNGQTFRFKMPVGVVEITLVSQRK